MQLRLSTTATVSTVAATASLSTEANVGSISSKIELSMWHNAVVNHAREHARGPLSCTMWGSLRLAPNYALCTARRAAVTRWFACNDVGGESTRPQLLDTPARHQSASYLINCIAISTCLVSPRLRSQCFLCRIKLRSRELQCMKRQQWSSSLNAQQCSRKPGFLQLEWCAETENPSWLTQVKSFLSLFIGPCKGTWHLSEPVLLCII